MHPSAKYHIVSGDVAPITLCPPFMPEKLKYSELLEKLKYMGRSATMPGSDVTLIDTSLFGPTTSFTSIVSLVFGPSVKFWVSPPPLLYI